MTTGRDLVAPLTAPVSTRRIGRVERIHAMFVSRVCPVLPISGKKSPVRRREQGMTISHATGRGPCRRDGPPVDVVEWRLCRLLQADFPREVAARLAAQPGVDVHALLALVDRGCPPVLAARILAPLPVPGQPA